LKQERILLAQLTMGFQIALASLSAAISPGEQWAMQGSPHRPIALPQIRRTVPLDRPKPGMRGADPRSLPLPPGMGNAEFGRLVGWTHGRVDPGNVQQTMELIPTLPQRIDAMRKGGLTADMAKAWADFYHKEAFRVPGNPNAAARSIYMRAVEEALRK